MAETQLTPKPSYAEKQREKGTDVPESPEKKKHVEKVVKGNVKRKKKPAAKKVGEAIIGEDVSEVKSYLLWDVLIPAVKDTIADLVKKGIDAVLFGGAYAPRNIKREGSRSRASYSDYYDRNRRKDEYRRRRGNRRSLHSFDDILFEDRYSAENVLECMVDITMDYGMVSVADFYELAGEEAQYTDNKYGWGELRDVEVIRSRDGWIIDLPKPEPID